MEEEPKVKNEAYVWGELEELGGDFEGFRAKSEQERVREQLYEHTVDMATAEAGELGGDFKSEMYLFHGAKVEQVEQILRSGELLSAGELYERTMSSKRAELEAAGKTEEEIQDELKRVFIPRNSGQEGISWSANGIDALPGTREHLAGFVAAPEDVLGADKLVVPSRPAPYELLQVSDGVNTERFFEAKKQSDVWGYKQVSLAETASVDSGLMRLIIAAKYEREHDKSEDDEFARALRRSLLAKFAERGGLPAEELRGKYKLHDDGSVELEADLHQQKFDETYLPPAAVWMQAMIDTGMFKGTSCEGLNVAQLVKRSFEDAKLPNYMLYWAREQGKKHDERYEAELDKAKGIALPVEKMYFVTNHRDLDKWVDVMVKSGHCPKGILLYDDDKVVMENFAQEEPGDHEELASEIGRVVGADGSFWLEKMGVDLKTAPRAGHMGQVLADRVVRHNVGVKLENGQIVVTDV